METTLTAEDKKCLNCQAPVGPGRKDKKYCSEPCKTEFNNRLKEQKNEGATKAIPGFVRDINAILIKNWQIMHDCLPPGSETCKIRVRDLNARGFIYKFFTSQRVNEHDGETYYFCYDVGYKTIRDDTWLVIVRNENMVRLSGPAHS